ncbi:AMP-binding protein, partial [Aliikangiella sp. G2MR2-5]|uniref:AMP-binding protein n=1 Tax=Aliikangiella sp. G2MR2-5 TaxID=2788943 RepID=UPI0018AB23D5
LVEHNRIVLALDNSERFLLLSNYVFDASVEVIMMAILTGGTLIVASEQESLSSIQINHLVESQAITHIDAPSSLLKVLDIESHDSVKRVVSGGERTEHQLYERYGSKLVNAYGPTETTITSHQYQCLSRLSNSNIPIGKVVANARSYVLNESMQPVPTGSIGELYIGGAGVARGYWNRPELTTS